MADVALPSVATATPAAADTVVGVQGGAVKRMSVAGIGAHGSFSHSGTYAAGSLGAKAQGVVSVKDAPFNAVGDGTTDDTAAVHAAFDAAKASGGRVYFPAGKYRVTSGYTQATAYKDLHIEGVGSSRENNGDQGSIIILDSNDPAVFFYLQSARHHLQASNITFKCAQYALDRPFFKFAATGAGHHFSNVNFESVERPIVYATGCYFQSSALRDVQFRASGTIHSEATGADLFGTLLVLDNCNHESSVPENTEKIVCNLRGIRQIQGRNFLLEGALPSADWTVLKLFNGYDPAWSVYPTANFEGFHSEWSGAFAPAYLVDQVRGRVRFAAPGAFISPTRKYKLSESARVEIVGASFSISLFDPIDAFELESAQCAVTLEGCGTRSVTTIVDKRIIYRNSFLADADAARLAVPVSNDAAKCVYRYEGGYLDSEEATLSLFSGTTATPSLDADMRRMLSIIPAGEVINAMVRIKARGVIEAGDPFSVVARVRLPVFASGTVQLRGVLESATVVAATFDSTYSGQIVDVSLPFRVTAAPTLVGFGCVTLSTTGTTGTLDILSLAFYQSPSFPASTYEIRRKNIVTWNSAAPTAGEWAKGDIVYNNAPAAAGSVGWVCVTAGTPGTWKTFGAIAP